jgi:SulP family sulfate permease
LLVSILSLGTKPDSYCPVESPDKESEIFSEPFNTLLNAFSSFHDVGHDTLRQIAPYFERFPAQEGVVLWENKDTPDGLYIIESGVLRASYKFAEHSPVIEESMVSGTLAGELSALSGMPRNARVVVERQAVLWKLSLENMRRLETEHPHLAQTFVQLVLKGKSSLNPHPGMSLPCSFKPQKSMPTFFWLP